MSGHRRELLKHNKVRSVGVDHQRPARGITETQQGQVSGLGSILGPV